MRVRVLVFARLREIIGSPETLVGLSGGACVADLWAALVEEHRALSAERSCTRAACNGRVVGFEAALSDGDEVAFLPPVGGG